MLQENKHTADNHSFNFGFNRLGSLSEMMEAGKRYPYSLPVQAYLAKTLKQSSDFDYERFVKLSAVLSPDRQWLYQFIHTQVRPALAEKPAEVKTAPVVEPVVTLQEMEPVVEAVVVQEKVVETPVLLVEEPLNIDLHEVELPAHEKPVQDDGDNLIGQVLEQVDLDPIIEKETPIVEAEPVVVQEPVTPKDLVQPVKVDLLEREILKEAIDKSIQKEVGEIQPDFLSTKENTTEESTENQPESGFQYWLNPSRKKVESREEKLRKIDALIEKFIKSEPRIVPKKSEFFSPASAAKQSVVVNEDLVSEPLALIFEKQGYFDKAIKAYEKLSLKIPEKRAYFATRIEKIKEIIRNIKNNKE